MYGYQSFVGMTCPGEPKQGPSGGLKMDFRKTLLITALPLSLAVSGCETPSEGKSSIAYKSAMKAQKVAKRASVAASSAAIAANAAASSAAAAASSAAAAARAAEAAAAEAKAAGDKADRVFRKGMRK